MSTTPLYVTGKKREWVTPLLLGPCQYKDQDTQEYLTCPLFCPIAMICTGIISGRIVTQLYDETPCCFEMGCRGLCCCCCSIPIHVGSPLGGMSFFLLVSYCLRQRVIEKYYVNEPESCCCGPCNPCCEFLHINCNYPCSMFQMHVSIKEWERERRIALASTTPSSLSNPQLTSVTVPTSPERVQPSYPPQTPVAVPRDAAQGYLQTYNPVMYTPVQAVVADASTTVQVAVPVATPVVNVEYYSHAPLH